MPVRFVERVLIPVGFAVAALSFVLPFATQRLSSAVIVAAETWSGVTLTVGGASREHVELANWNEATGQFALQDVTDTIPAEAGSSDGTITSAQPGFIVAAVLILSGLVAAILAGSRIRTLLSAIAAFGAVVALGLAEGGFLRGLIPPTTDGIAIVDGIGSTWQPTTVYGYWVAIGLLAAVGLTAAVRYLRGRRPIEGATETAEPAEPTPGPVIELTT